jgi:PAS domain S-box-containing protein
MTEGVRQRSVALILARELAVNLVTPMLVWDEEGTLVYFNESAQAIIGRRYEEMADMTVEELQQFQPTDLDGSPLKMSDMASTFALEKREPAHRVMVITSLDGVRRRLDVTAYPLLTRGDEFVGAVAIFWEPDEA